MAYNDWGAYVFRGERRRRDREDVGVFDDQDKDLPSGVRIFANLVRHLERAGDEPEEMSWATHAHHAVLGDHEVRLCGFKRRPELWELTAEGQPRQVALDPYVAERDPEDGDPVTWRGTWLGYTFEALKVFNLHHVGEQMALRLVEPDGTEWTSLCGYLFGAGHTDLTSDDSGERASKLWWLNQLGLLP